MLANNSVSTSVAFLPSKCFLMVSDTLNFFLLGSKNSNCTLPFLPIVGLPVNSKSFTSSKNIFLFFADCALATVLHAGKTASINLSVSLDMFFARIVPPGS